MSAVRAMSWYMAVAVLTLATFIGWTSPLAANAAHAQFCGAIVEPLGYICAEYRTYSADGYELVMHRVGTKPRARLDKSSQSQTDDFDTSLCEDVNQPFNSPRCLRLNSSSSSDEPDRPESDELSARGGLEASTDQDLPYQMDQTPSSNPTSLHDGEAQEQEVVPDRDPFWRDEDEESQHSNLPSQARLDALPFKVQLPIKDSDTERNSSVSDQRTEGKHHGHKGSSVHKKRAKSPHSSGHHGHNAIVTGSVVTSSSGSDLPPARLSSEGRSTKRKRSRSHSPRAPKKSKTPHRHRQSPPPSHDQNSEKFSTGKVPVLVMHQELLNGDSWFQPIAAGDRLLPLLLVDAGFDVWIGHRRASYWSHAHLSLQHDDQRYWNWTWDELAKYDTPALLKLIHNTTGFSAHYVGLSQSATVGAAAATMPESSQFMRSLTLIGPPIYRGYTSSVVLNTWAFLFGNTIDQTYYNEGYQNGAFNFSRAFPVNYLSGQGPVGAALATISGPNCCLGSTVVRFSNGWDGTTSFKNLLHDQQGVRTNFWRHYDYEDAEKNNEAYGMPSPPDYLPEDIPSHIPILVVYGGQDIYSTLAGIRYLLSRLGTRYEEAYVPAYAHYDLSYSVSRTADVFLPILQFLERYRWN